MGWGTGFIAEVYLNKQTFNNELEVQNKIDENIGEIERYKQKILMFVSSNPKDIVPKEWEDQPIDWLNNSVNELVEDIFLLSDENVRLQQYIEYLNENGENRILIDWDLFSKIFNSETTKAYKSGMFNEDLSSTQPALDSKADVSKLIKTYYEFDNK